MNDTPARLGKPIESAVDGENNPIEFDLAYRLQNRPQEAVEALRQQHGDSIFILPISGGSCGGGIFRLESRPPGKVIGLRLDPPAEPRTSFGQEVDLTGVDIDQIIIDPANRQVYAGAAITLGQLNRTLRENLGESWRVPGADLTSYQYAAVGATFMTGGMGPQRRYFSDSVVAIALYDGIDTVIVNGDRLKGYAGTYGWSGMVSAVACRYHQFPVNEVAFTLPVSNDPKMLARLLARLAPCTAFQCGSENTVNSHGNSDLILGIEHVSVQSMQPLLNQQSRNPASARCARLRDQCQLAGAEGLVFVSGLTDQSADAFLATLTDDPDADEPRIGGIALEHAELFHNPEEMRDLREAIPYAARMQTPKYRYLYKNHSDATVRMTGEQVEPTMRRLWEANCRYVNAVQALFDAEADLYGEVLVYGHLNPQGVDPHNRVTLACDNEAVFTRTQQQLKELRAEFYRALANLCQSGEAKFIGGEKTADSERAIFNALGGTEQAPTELRQRFEQQQQTVKSAAPMFNWRARAPYGNYHHCSN